MKTKKEYKQHICKVIDCWQGQIKKFGDHIMANPELGFKEFRTAELVVNRMKEFGIPCQTGLAITGVKGVLEGKKPGPTVALMGELDALIVRDHPAAKPETGAAHACGHNAQIAGLLGAMIGMVEAKVAEKLAGTVVFFAVPAEEYVDLEYRARLVSEGRLAFLCGKPELVRLGHFDDIDMAMMIHTHSETELKKAAVAQSSNGAVVKMIRFIGRAAHAGAAPHMGINALNAAHVALAAIHAQRETFQDRDTIRVHPIISSGGDLVNVVPSEVRMETYVRAKTNEAIIDANAKVDRGLRAGAMALGARVVIKTFPGYMPLRNDTGLKRVFQANCVELFGEGEYIEAGHDPGSTDLGDISQLMPALHASMGGAKGAYHSAEWHISDKEMAYLAPAKSLAMAAVDLLWGDAEKAIGILAEHRPAMTKPEYLERQQKLFRTEVYEAETWKSEDP